jgi:peptidoglycan/LPS O-acetylase OafA/YrhL
LNPWLSILIAAVLSTIGALILERFLERPILARAARRAAEPDRSAR